MPRSGLVNPTPPNPVVYDFSLLGDNPFDLDPGPLSTTRFKTAIKDGAAQSLRNCSTRRGVYELDDRYRQFQDKPSSGAAGGMAYFNVGYMDEITKIQINGSPTGGTFTITWNGSGPTVGIARNATAATVQTAMEGLANIEPGEVSVTGGPGPDSPYTVNWRNRWGGQNVPALTVDATGLTGPGAPYTVTVTTTREGGSYEEFIAIHNNDPFKIAASEVGNSDGSVSAAWVALTDPGVSGGDWIGWQWGPYEFFATETDAQRVMWKTIGQNDLQFLRSVNGQLPIAAVGTDIPPYDRWEYISGSDTPLGLLGSGTVNSSTINTDGEMVLDGTAASTPRTNVLTTLQVSLLVGVNRPNHQYNDYIGFRATTEGPWTVSGVADVTIRDDNGVDVVVPITWGIEPGARAVKIWCNLTAIAPTLRTAVQRVRVRIYCNSVAGRGLIKLQPHTVGGRFLQYGAGGGVVPAPPPGGGSTPAPINPSPNIQYGLRYFRDGTYYSDFLKLTLDGLTALGELFDGNYLGSWGEVTVPSTASFGFTAGDTVQIFRSVPGQNREPGNDWYLIGEYPNTGTIDHVDKLNGGEIASTKPWYSGVDQPGTAGTLAGDKYVSQVTCGCTWKGANFMFRTDGFAYSSRVNTAFEIPWNDATVVIDPTMAGSPTKFIVAYDQASPVIAVVSQESLYMFSTSEAYAMSGPTPALSHYPFKIPGARGVLGRRAACKLGDGALFGATDGLWYVEVPKNYEGEASKRILERLTEDMQDSWTTLLGSAGSSLVVVSVLDEIWCFCETRYLHRTREGVWVVGAWANDKSVKAATADPRRGIQIQFTDGTVGSIGDYASDGGTNAAGSNGTAPTWDWTTKRYTVPMHILSAYAQWSGTAPVIQENSERAANKDATFTASGGVETVQYKRSENPGGDFWEFKISGAANTIVSKASVWLAPMERRHTSRS